MKDLDRIERKIDRLTYLVIGLGILATWSMLRPLWMSIIVVAGLLAIGMAFSPPLRARVLQAARHVGRFVQGIFRTKHDSSSETSVDS